MYVNALVRLGFFLFYDRGRIWFDFFIYGWQLVRLDRFDFFIYGWQQAAAAGIYFG
tara:strand:- start:339 stop:506 length:168 start_codon:yes stop_codon:yes gene_type:complete